MPCAAVLIHVTLLLGLSLAATLPLSTDTETGAPDAGHICHPYLNDKVVHENMEKILKRLRDELQRAENVHASLNNKKLPVVSHFNDYMKSHFDLMEKIIPDFAEECAKKLDNVWSADATAVGKSVMADLAIIKPAAKKASIDRSNLYLEEGTPGSRFSVETRLVIIYATQFRGQSTGFTIASGRPSGPNTVKRGPLNLKGPLLYYTRP